MKALYHDLEKKEKTTSAKDLRRKQISKTVILFSKIGLCLEESFLFSKTKNMKNSSLIFGPVCKLLRDLIFH
ncbi:hypothetical protein Anas_11399 [Armadillidium nasatum]|uniref:Uncharacterized protein n=1 Tax=Armadillidium nasatum TaxID=96803 RepID=A0A5N5SQ10_9CRUS|nr:hypothetical protein Anas_11399 [Armadillidium nasatum]